MSNLEDLVAVQWTCSAIVCTEVDEFFCSIGRSLPHETLLQRAAEAVASCAAYERGLAFVDFFAEVEQSHSVSRVMFRVRLDLTPQPMACVSLAPGFEAPKRFNIEGDADHLLVGVERQAVRHERV